VAAFDIDKNKVGKDFAEAIFTKPNNTLSSPMSQYGRQGGAGMTHDGWASTCPRL
jgi:myo-inositol-1-phosphate synthase